MNRKRMTTCIVIALLVLSVLIGAGIGAAASPETTAAPVVTVNLPANQTIEVNCLGDDLIIVTNDANDRAAITCRVWVEGGR